jgi:cyclohexanecarboxylate-CoA ligase
LSHFEPILSDARRTDLIDRGLWINRLICDFLDQAAARDPTVIAIVEQRNGTHETLRMRYGELRDHSIRIAAALVALGVQRNDVVSIQLPNWWHFAAVHVACVRIGAVINPLLPIFRERELEFMLGFAGSRVLIVPQTYRGFDYPAMAARLRPLLPALQHVLVVGGDDPATAFETCVLGRAWETETDTAALFAARRPNPNDVTEIMYTSGTTGQPKGVMHTANTLLCKATLANELFQFRPTDAIFMGSPMAHQTGFMYAAVLSIFNGT